MKYKAGFATEIIEAENYKKEQEKLKRKHKIEEENENIIVVEKNNIFKFIVHLSIRIIKFIASTIILILSAIGSLSLIYPNPRSEIIFLLKNITEETLALF